MKFLKVLILCILLYLSENIFSQTFEKFIGSPGIDYGYFIQQTDDGGYIVTGKTDSNFPNGTDIFLMKLDSFGNQEWYKTFGGNVSEWGKSVQQTKDGGYIITGWTDSFSSNGSYHLWLIKTDSEGNEQWNKIKNTTYASDGLDVKQTVDGGYIIAGEVMKAVNGAGVFDGWVIKTDKNGNTVWNKRFGGNKRDVLFNSKLTPDGGYIFLGYTISYSSDDQRDYWLIKTDSLGIEEWSRTYDGIGGHDWGRRIRLTSDGGYIFTGASKNLQGHFQMVLIKTDDLGTEEWRKTYGGSKSAQGRGLDLTEDGGYILSGSYAPNNNLGKGWLVKTDSLGNILWDKKIGESGTDSDIEYVQQTLDGGYICTGFSFSSDTESEIIIVKVDEDGLVDIDQDDTFNSENFGYELLQNYPNPFNPATIIEYIVPSNNYGGSSNVTLKIYDLLGREVAMLVNAYQSPGRYKAEFSGADLTSGTYIYRLSVNGNSESKKMILIK